MSKRRMSRRRRKKMIRIFMIRCGMLTVVLLFLFGLIWGGTFLWNRLTTDGDEQTFAGASVIEQPETFPKGKPRIMIDAGHGGKDQGTSAGNVLEKDLNLQVAEKLAKELKKRGALVLLTRTDDTKIPLEERAAMANEKEADLFVSIHCNYCEDDSSVQGLECYYREGSDSARQLAENVVTAVEESSLISCRGTRTADFSVLRNTSMTAVLVEIGYLSNSSERQNLGSKDYQQELIDCLADGILMENGETS